MADAEFVAAATGGPGAFVEVERLTITDERDVAADARYLVRTPSGVTVDVAHLVAAAWEAHRRVVMSGISRGRAQPAWRMHHETAKAMLAVIVRLVGQNPLQPELDGGWTFFGWVLQPVDDMPIGELELVWRIK